ncbi:MAG: ATP-dependent DNA helicase RecG [Bacteroidales bacterium]|nr:ATP-dependent DNA helicase RecG [Lentimicrobiaceae bacterium]MDD5694864.1 ATP-dependent DNA helicase RecG [Bacteroidales bacterium]
MYRFLDTPIEYLKGVGPKRAEMLRKELQIATFGDLFEYYPFRYVDRSRIQVISEINNDLAYVQLIGRIIRIQTIGKGPGTRLVAVLKDHTGEIELVWFNGIKWIKDKLVPDVDFLVFGKPAWFNGKYNIPHPEIDLASEQTLSVTGALQPFYNSSEKLKSRGFNSKGFSRIMHALTDQAIGNIPETLPASIITRFRFISREEALSQIHFPADTGMLQKAQFRLRFEELFFIQLNMLKLKLLRKQKVTGLTFPRIGAYFNDFFHHQLPFPLTSAQKKVLREIRTDVGSGRQMNRLLQGDVGSGKTLVAIMSMLMALDNHYQACMMAPTEILAGQHYESLSRFLKGMDVQFALLTGSVPASKRKNIHERLRNGELQILVGTHALIEEDVRFQNLGLVVIDEQHRFGVAQRARLWEKREVPPHVLVMTATPIPRTLAMTLYGDLDISVIDELPPGRKPVKTFHFSDSARLRVFGFMKDEIRKGRQIYVVYPLIQESEALDLKDLMDGYESIVREFPLPEYAVSIVHGKLKTADKEYEMQRFIRKETQIMVATTVIEVGVDIPNASVMIIENAERFGLSQLHQLRGRVGRGADQSYCILMTGNKLTTEGRKRIETMVRTTDGFEIAEADLKIRGPGDLEGTQQSGMILLRIADLVRDEKLLTLARNEAISLLDNDPDLKRRENQPVREQIPRMKKMKSNWGMIS